MGAANDYIASFLWGLERMLDHAEDTSVKMSYSDFLAFAKIPSHVSNKRAMTMIRWALRTKTKFKFSFTVRFDDTEFYFASLPSRRYHRVRIHQPTLEAETTT